MNLVKDAEGAISFGLVEAGVYFARFTGKLSERLGMAHLNDLQQALEASPTIAYFADSSDLTSYDLLARSAFVRLLLSNRKRFSEVVILNWAGGASSTGQALAASVGEPVVMLSDRHEFDHRLAMVSGRALQALRVGATPHAAAPAAEGSHAAASRANRS